MCPHVSTVETQQKGPYMYIGKIKIEFGIACLSGYSTNHFDTKLYRYLAHF